MALVTSKTKAEHDRQHMEKQSGKKSENALDKMHEKHL